MSTEHDHPAATNQDTPAVHGNPAHWQGGEKFQVLLRETERDGTPELSLQVFDGNEIVVVQFLGSVREARTLFLPTEQLTPLPAHASPLPTLTQEIVSPVAPTPPVEAEKKPTKLTGTITQVGQLGETKKKKQPMLLFSFHDETNHVERRAVAFDTIAQRLAAPETALQVNEPITLFAWKHLNTVHIQGQPREVEDWYVQKAIYHETVFEKPRPTLKSRRQEGR